MIPITLYQKTKTGATNSWKVYTDGPMLNTEFGQVGGKMQISSKVCEATNVGRSNERIPTAQAEFEAEALVKEKLRLKYSRTVGEIEVVRIQPMLANDGKKAKLVFPLDVQPKYDGLRALWDGTKLISRGNKVYDVKHISDAIIAMGVDGMLDGELYTHGVPLQILNSWVKKPKEESLLLEYHVYDKPGPGTWLERNGLLSTIQFVGPIKLVETTFVYTMDDLVRYHDQFVSDGFEGAIIRNHSGLYEFGKRSRDLLKWKNSEDAEFKIVDMTTGTGKYANVPIFKCKNDVNELMFDVVPTGTMEARLEMLDEANIGKWLTVKFIGRTDDMIPKFAVGKSLRDDL
jgi:DNA ligase-1